MCKLTLSVLLALFAPAIAVATSVAAPTTLVVAGEVSPALNVSDYSTEDEKLEAVLTFVFTNEARRFGWPANYQSMWCPTNVFNLLKRLDQAHVDLSRANVWYILPPETAQGAGESVIFPHAARPGERGPVTEWSFHVVLEIEGRILDLDFTSQPHVVSIVSYAATMWEKGPLASAPDAQPLFVRRIPAREYLAQYANNWSYYEAGADGRYPAVEMGTLLPKIDSSRH